MISKHLVGARRAGLSLVALVAASLVPLPAVAQDLAERIAVCTGCHGEAGLPTAPDIPNIWGQEFYYLYVQLKDYKAGRRQNEIMNGIVADLTKAEMQALAQHFSEQKWRGAGFKSSEADIQRGRTAAAAGQCPQCHLGSYLGDSRVPRMAGQQAAYLERTMLEMKNKVRMNAAAMSSLMRDFSDQDIRAMARYLAGL